MLKRSITLIGPPVLGVVIGMIIGAFLIQMAGVDPLTAYRAMFRGALGGERQLTETILKTIPLLMIGLGLTVAFTARVWNIGCEGQFFIGSLFGSYIALRFPSWPAGALIPAMLVAGMIGGALWGLIPALLRTRRGMNEIITTLMLNYVAIFTVEYMARGPLNDPHGYLPETAKFVDAARMPQLFGTRIHIGVFIVLVLIPIVYLLVWRLPTGFRLRAIGSNPSVARFAGINVERGIIFVLVLSGLFAGLAGIMEVSHLHGRLKGTISGGYGFTGILVALLGRLHPIGVLFAALFFTVLTIGATSMHTLTGLPVTVANAIQALVVLFALGFDAYFRMRKT